MRISIVLAIILIMACSREDGSNIPAPPTALVQQKILQNHGYNRIDEYHCIRDDLRQNETVIELLELENAYTDAVMKHTTDLQKSLIEELSSRLPSAKKSVPIQHDQYLYFQEFLPGKQYPVYKRALTGELDETTLLDLSLIHI